MIADAGDGRWVQVIANPISGRASNRPIVAELRRRLMAHGWNVRAEFTRGVGDATRFAAECRVNDTFAIVVVGGDGTIREVAAGAIHTGVPIAVMPTGTDNLLARYFGVRRSLDSLCHVLQEGRKSSVDVAVMRSGEGSPSRPFLLVAGAGFDAEVVRRFSSLRKGHITHGDYFWPIWRTLWTYQHPNFVVKTEQGVLFQGRGLVFIGNIPRYAVGLRICHRATPRDGRLDVCVYECDWQAPMLWHAGKTLMRRHIGSRHVIYQSASRVYVSADRHVDIQLDGDLVDPLPAEFAMTNHKVAFLVPPEWRE